MPTLEDWLRRSGRTWPEVAQVFVDVGGAIESEGPFALGAVQLDPGGQVLGPVAGEVHTFRSSVIDALGGPGGPAPAALVAGVEASATVTSVSEHLERSLARHRARRAVSGGMCVALLGVCVALGLWVHSRDPRCRGAIPSVYPPSEAAALAPQFTAARSGRGATSFVAFDRAVKAFDKAQHFTAAEACRTRHPAAALGCLAARRAQLVEVLALAHQGPPLAAAAGLSILPSPTSCLTATTTVDLDRWLKWARLPAGPPPDVERSGVREASGLVALAHGHPRQALTRLSAALTRVRKGSPEQVRLLAYAARAYMMAGDSSQAVFHYRRAESASQGAGTDPNLVIASSVAMIRDDDPNGGLSRLLTLGDDRDLDAHRVEAFAHERAGHLALARTTIETAIGRFEGVVGAENVAMADLHLQRGWLLQALGQHGPAVSAHRRALALFERRLGAQHLATYRAQVGLAAAELEIDSADVALERLTAAIANEDHVTIGDRDRAEARFVLARAMFSEGQRRRAESHAAAARAFALRQPRPYPSLVEAIEKLRARLRTPL